ALAHDAGARGAVRPPYAERARPLRKYRDVAAGAQGRFRGAQIFRTDRRTGVRSRPSPRRRPRHWHSGSLGRCAIRFKPSDHPVALPVVLMAGTAAPLVEIIHDTAVGARSI